eukprot:4894205-Prymnesium_polylepis.2
MRVAAPRRSRAATSSRAGSFCLRRCASAAISPSVAARPSRRCSSGRWRRCFARSSSSRST